MKPLELPDVHRLRAALGWLELGNTSEAIVELDGITPEFLTHPDVLEVRWQILAAIPNWDACLGVARSVLEVDPERASGWLHQAYSLRRAPGGTIRAAWDALLPAAEKFPNVATIPYNLACYASQMGRLTEARDWLRRAFQIAKKAGEEQHVRALALTDPDLEPLRTEIGNLEV